MLTDLVAPELTHIILDFLFADTQFFHVGIHITRLLWIPHIAVDRYSPVQLVLPILQLSLKALYILSLCYHQGHSWSGKVQNSHQCILQRSNGILPLCCSRKYPDTQWKVFWVKPSCYILEFSQHYPKRKIPVTFPGMLRYFLALHLCIELINLVSLIVQIYKLIIKSGHTSCNV